MTDLNLSTKSDYAIIKKDTLVMIADAIREGTGETVEYTLDEIERILCPDLIYYIQGLYEIRELPEGITSIGTGAFYGCTNLALTSLPEGITSIGSSAFYKSNLALTSLPEGVTSIGYNAFSDCTNLALTSLPEGITSIGANAFYNTNIALTSIPEGITRIEMGTFQSCPSLESITFKGAPTFIAANVFDNCSNLTTINVPWAEGEVANAPWGATNATINYGYAGGA